jgi:hypothetical protein
MINNKIFDTTYFDEMIFDRSPDSLHKKTFLILKSNLN